MVESRTPEREVGVRNLPPLWCVSTGNTQKAMATSRHDSKIVDWDVKPPHKQIILYLKHELMVLLRTKNITFVHQNIVMLLQYIQCTGSFKLCLDYICHGRRTIYLSTFFLTVFRHCRHDCGLRLMCLH